MNEDDLCRLFAEKMAASEDFKNWVLSQTTFGQHRFASRVLKDAQILARPKVKPENWWRHWYWQIPELEKEHETDIFLVLKNTDSGEYFALHIENKLNSKLRPGQAASYKPRSLHVAAFDTRLPHREATTILLAPARLFQACSEDVALFDSAISHEQVAVFISEFETG
ncbi:hypothetical protein DFR52_101639 [Hoeflea marina]|uniref:Uncharacterized protein n=1 Tax=Hoeflea marina TaxID=274592 RepID=A0A317PWT8_9HYPH|nr:hypothetical protein [Hoeflea marina]PWW03950.1 hypothetical protein DFR52_101639 [Hoeflea marina]